ncbi:MAG: TonB-dependent receptor [Alphaproteobacteria bacterium]|nr:TonB-dependent receptor [Alphaproteobacteria bacterium]
MKLHHSIAGALLAVGPVLGEVAFSQATPAADTVVIQALRLDQTASEAGTSVAVVLAADIERRALTFGGDAVAIVPGVTVTQSGSFGGTAYARIRGNASGQTLVLVDGVTVNDAGSPGGGFDFSTLDLADVERIEVLKGPQSTLWGSDAIGGVISIVTKSPPEGFGWSGFGEGGSFDTFRGGGAAGGRAGRMDGRLSAVWQTSEGISKADERDGNPEKDGFESVSLSGRGGIDIADRVRADFTARWTDADYEFDGFAPPTFSLGDTNERTESEELAGSATLTADAFGGLLTNTFQVTRSEIDRQNFDGASATFRNEGERTGYRYSGLVKMAAGHQLGFGVEREESAANGEKAKTDSLHALYAWSPLETVTLTGGLRYDDDDRYGSETTGKLAASWQVVQPVRLRATWGQGFKAPTIFQSTFICTFCGLSAPNASLRAETSEAFDVGLDWTIGEAVVSLTAFDQETENLIDFSFTRGYANIAFARQQGVEALVQTPLGEMFALKAGYAYIDAEDGSGARLPRTPLHSGDVELIVSPPGPFEASLAVRHNGEQADGFGPDVPGWTRLDAAASYEISTGVEVYGRLENVLDEQYQQIGGYGAPGLSGLLGLRVKR